MSDACGNCRHTRLEAIAEAKTLGLEREFLVGRYTCCQITDWADEQLMAWLEAIRDNGNAQIEEAATHHEMVALVELGETEEILVRVHARRSRLRNPNELR